VVGAIKAVLFDVGDTLWHSQAAPPAAEFRRLAAERAARFLNNAGLAHSDPKEIARIAWNALEAAQKRARATDKKEPDYAMVAQAALARVGLQLSVPDASALMEAIYVSGEDGGKAAYPDAAATLEELRARGFKLGIVTNRGFGGPRFREDLRAAGLDIGWDTVAVSVEVGYLKPHPATFQAALEELALRPAEAVMVGNSLAEDVAGAQSLGMLAAWRRCAADAEAVTPDFVFDELCELLEWDLLHGAGR
jgi:putative hydrolase of the HAD superfamily